MSRLTQLAGAFYDWMPAKRLLLSPLRPLALPHRLYQHLHFRGDFDVRTPVRPFRLRHYGYEVENELFWEGLPGRRERASMALWMEVCREARVVFDVGANTGVYALVARSMNPGARVFAFEPVARIFQKLRANCAMNGFDLVLEEVALSNRDGSAVLFDTTSEHVYAASLVHDPATGEGSRPVEVAVRTIDAVVRQHRVERIDLMKIDVEGHEPEVLEGMGDLLGVFRPTLLIEILDDDVAGRIEALTAPHGYLFFDIDEELGPRRTEHLAKGAKWNQLLCLPEIARRLGLV